MAASREVVPLLYWQGPALRTTGAAGLLRTFGRDAVLLDLAVERTDADAKAFGRFALVGGLPQDALDVQLLEAFDGLAQFVHDGGVVAARCQVRRQVGRR